MRNLPSIKELYNASYPEYEARVETFKELTNLDVCQWANEAGKFYQVVKQAQPKVFVEIGSAKGGSLYCFAGACAPGALVIGIDDGEHEGARKYLRRTIEKLDEEGYNAHWVRGDSHKPETRESLITVLRKGTMAQWGVDFLFIDGDHSLEGVLADWKDYRGFVRPGGMVAFHDATNWNRKPGARAAWMRTRSHQQEWMEFSGGCVSRGYGIRRKAHPGIGVLWK